MMHPAGCARPYFKKKPTDERTLAKAPLSAVGFALMGTVSINRSQCGVQTNGI
jgi:hypothetical protein